MTKALTTPKTTSYLSLSRKHRLFIDNLIKYKFNAVKAYQDTYPDSKEMSTRANAHKLVVREDIKNALDEMISEGYILSRYAEISTGNNDDISIKALNSLAKIKGMLQDKPQVLQQFNIDTHNTDKELVNIIQGNTSPKEE